MIRLAYPFEFNGNTIRLVTVRPLSLPEKFEAAQSCPDDDEELGRRLVALAIDLPRAAVELMAESDIRMICGAIHATLWTNGETATPGKRIN